MTEFCKKICGNCPQCKQAMEECKQEEKAYTESEKFHAKNPGANRIYRDEIRIAALDYEGKP